MQYLPLVDGPAFVFTLAALMLALRAPTPRTRPLVMALVVGTTPALEVFFGALLLLSLELEGPRSRALRGVLGLGLLGALLWAWQAGSGSLHALPMTRSIVQIRALAGFSGLLLAVAFLPPHLRWLGLGAWLYGFVRLAVPLWPEATTVASPIIGLVVAGVAVVAALMTIRWPSALGVAAMGVGVLGALTGTSAGVTGATLIAAGLVLTTDLDRWRCPVLLAPGLGLGGLALSGFAATHAVGPVSLDVFAVCALVAVAAAALMGLARAIGAPAGRPAMLSALASVMLGGASLAGWQLPGADAAAARASRRGIPPQDTHGWRRLHRLEQLRAPAPDAGVTDPAAPRG